MADGASTSEPLADRFRVEIDRAIQRNLKGLGYLGSPAPAVGVTPKTLLQRRGTLSLYHYKPLVEEVYRVPILFVMAISNRGYIFDLAPGQSMVEFLLKRGYDIYVMDWNPPSADESTLKFENYVLDFIPDCIRRVQEHSGVDEISLVGYCMGGLISALYTALHADNPLKNLVCFTTPVDFEEMKLYRVLTDARHMDVDRYVDTVGIIRPEIVSLGFDLLRPAQRLGAQARLWDNLWNDEYVKAYQRMDRWGSDILPMAGEFFRQFVKELLQKNALAKGEFHLDGRLVDLANIKTPFLHVAAVHDHIVPAPCSAPLVQRISSRDKEEVVLTGGHVSLIAGANAVKRMWPKLDEWLARRST